MYKFVCSFPVDDVDKPSNSTVTADKYSFREIESDSDSESDKSSDDSNSWPAEDCEFPVIKFRKRDRDLGILTPVKTSSLPGDSPSLKTVSDEKSEPGVSGTTGNGPKHTGYQWNQGHSAASNALQGSPGLHKIASDPGPSWRNPPVSVDNMYTPPSQPMFTIKSTHKITYNTPVYQLPDQQKASATHPNPAHINVRGSNVTVNLSPETHSSTLDLHRGLSHLSSPQKR